MTDDDYRKALQDEVATLRTLTAKYLIAQNYFNLAAMNEDYTTTDKCRQQMHDLLDLMLDSNAVSQMLIKNMAQKKGL